MSSASCKACAFKVDVNCKWFITDEYTPDPGLAVFSGLGLMRHNFVQS